MLDFLKRLSEQAATYEFLTWAGIINAIGFIVVALKLSAVSVVERAASFLNWTIEGSRKYRAKKRGFDYEPVYLHKPAAVDISPTRLALTVGLYMVLSVAVVAVADRV